jgi:polysaccharide export outer membrane protein
MRKILTVAAFTLTPLLSQTTPPLTGISPAYILGSGDQLTVFVADLPDEFADRTFRIDASGDVSLPVIGHLHAAGLTTNQLEQSADTSLVHVLKNPQVSISIAGFGSKLVSVLGAVNSPGVRTIEGPKPLFEMLSLSGGLRPDAGYYVKVSRNLTSGKIPLPDATIDPTGRTSAVTIKLKNILNATDAAENIMILPGDTISVPKAEIVYAVGSVVKPGGFPLNEHETLSALQVVSLAEGLQKTAAMDKAKILRSVAGSTERTEIAVNLKQLMAGKGSDVSLQPDDILFVPNSAAKSAGIRTIDAVVNMATGMAVYGRY